MKIKVHKSGSPRDVAVLNSQKLNQPIRSDVQNADSPNANFSRATAPEVTPKAGSLMKTGMTVGQIASELKGLNGPALKYFSCIEFRPGTPVENVGLIINTDGKSPRCPNQKLVMDNHHLRVMLDQIISFYGKKAESYELGFYAGMHQPGCVELTLVGTGLALPFNIKSAEVMGKLIGAL